MGLLPGVVMVAAGALCLGGAIIGRRWIGIAASSVMLLAMIDLTVSRIVTPVFWAGALVAAAVLLGFGLRGNRAAVSDTAQLPLASGPAPGAGTGPVPAPTTFRLASSLPAQLANPIRRRAWLPGSVMVAAALAYPATAWLVLGHGEATAASPGAAAAAPGHHSAATLTAALPLAAVLVLTTALVGLSVLAIRDRRFLPAAEAGGMAAMLLAMLAGHG